MKKSESRPLLRVEGQNVYICFRSFKYNFNYERDTAAVVAAFDQVLQNHPFYTVHFDMQSLTISELHKHHDFMTILGAILRERFDNRMDFFYLYNASMLLQQIFELKITNLLFDKVTLAKFKLVSPSPKK